MGATDMFSETKADFSGIPADEAKAPKLSVSKVIQKVIIAVDEVGTELAAAGTGFLIQNYEHRRDNIKSVIQKLVHLVQL